VIFLTVALLSQSVLQIVHSQEQSSSTLLVKSQEAKRNYENADWGVSLRYPSTYTLKEMNAPVEPGAFWYPGQSNIDGHAGSVDLVVVQIPNDLFPGTDLTRAVFSLSVNQSVTREECWTTASRNGATVNKLYIDGVEFRWSEGGDAASAASFKDYAGFTNSTCYEIETAVVTTRQTPEGISQLDPAELDPRMDEMLRSLKIHQIKTPQNLPSILSFTVEKLSLPSPPAAYRFLWDVRDASERGVTIDLNCYADVSMIEVIDIQNGDAVPCGKLKEITASKRSLELSFSNHTGVTLHPQVRLFAIGKEPVSRTVEMLVGTMAVIRGTMFQGRYVNSGSYIDLYPGQRYILYGDSFLPNETIWIGESSVPAKSSDGHHLEFSLPSTLNGGSFTFFLEDARGKSNALNARVVRSQPHISFYIPADASPAQSREMRNVTVMRGQRIRLVGVGFTERNKVWIGSTSIESEPDERFPQFGLYFTIPDSLKAGIYPLSVTNDLGKSNEIRLTFSSPD
jgi:hypothetical protein